MRFLLCSLLRLRGGLTRLRDSTRRSSFTLIELLTVMAVIAILAGLILSVSGYATKHGALARASAEIQAISSACESYKADNGTYPHQALATSGSGSTPYSDQLDPRTNGNSVSTNAAYATPSLELYEALTGDTSLSGTGGGAGSKNYLAEVKPDMWGRSNQGASVSSTNPVTYLSDPFGNCYGYSTAYATAIASGSTPTMGYNPTFDLWSTGGNLSTPYPASNSGTPGDPQLQWIKNW